MRYLQKGFTLVEIIVVVVIVGLFAFIGIRTWGAHTANELAKDTVTTESVRQVKSVDDVVAVESQLDKIDIDSSIEKELDAELTF